jgi:hypothetical protein
MAGVSLQPMDGLGLTSAVVSSSATAISAPAAVTSQIIRIYKLFLVVAGTTNLQFQDGTTALSGAIPMVANGAVTLDLDGQPWFTCSKGNAFTISNSGGIGVYGTVYYTATPFNS